MKLYLDTSILVSALTSEVETPRMQEWLVAQDDQETAISDWVITEFSAALSMKLRTGQIDQAIRARALAAFADITMESVTVLAVEQRHFRAAARIADQAALGARGGDALHLAVCVDYGARLCTLDRRLAAAAPQLGVDAALI